MSSSSDVPEGKRNGPGGDKLGIGEIFWYRNDVAEEDRAIELLTDKGELFFYRLRRHYLYRAGTLPYDPSAICTKMGYKTVRPFNAGFEELAAAGLVTVEDGMVRFPHVDRIIADVQANRDRKANDGRAGGDAKAANARNVQETSEKLPSNFGEVCSKPETETEQNQAPGSSLSTNNHEPLNKTTSVGSTATMPSRMNGGGGGSEIQQIIAGFDQLLVSHFGAKYRREWPVAQDAVTAKSWLDRAEGSVETVISAIGIVMQGEVARNGRVPGSLGYYRNSVPENIDDLLKPSTLVAGTSSRNGKQQAATDQGDQTWLKAMNLAWDNGHSEEYEKLKHLAVTDPKQANEIGRSIMEIVSRKKERAAA